MKLLLRESGRYPLTGRGDINTYAVFAETARRVIGPRGRSGLVLPTGIATDATTAPFFADLVTTKSVVSVYDFENEEKIFPAVHNQFRFCLFTVAGRRGGIDEIRLAFRARQVRQIEGKRFTLTPEDISRLNPNTLTCPVFVTPRDAQIVTGLYRRVPVLRRRQPEENPWGISFLRMFDTTNDARLFRTRDVLEGDGWTLAGNIFMRRGARMLPLYEGKMVYQFDNRFATYEGATQAQLNKGTLPHVTSSHHADPLYVSLPHYWVDEAEVTQRLSRRSFACKSVLLGHRRVARSSDERSCISALIPWGAASNALIITAGPSVHQLISLIACYNSFAYDYLLRNSFTQASVPQATSEQIPVPDPSIFLAPASWDEQQSVQDWISNRVFELIYTGQDFASFAAELDDDRAPFIWDEERQFAIRAELDAAFFHLYGVKSDDLNFIMDSFRALQNNDRARFNRIKQLTLEVYDAMAEVIRTGEPYRTILNPPPGQGPRHG